MKLSLRYQIAITLLPLFLLMAVASVYGGALLYRVGGRIDQVLRENFDSVLSMQRVRESIQRMDFALQFAMAGREAEASKQYADNWTIFDENVGKERDDIAVSGERELVEQLDALRGFYQKRGSEFFGTYDPQQRRRIYFGEPRQPGEPVKTEDLGLVELFRRIETVANEIANFNALDMEAAARSTSQRAQSSLLWFAVGLGVAGILSLELARGTVRAILRPVRSVTESVLAIGAGNLDQIVPATSSDELGQLAGAVNQLARQLRDYRQSQHARVLRLQQTGQATIDSFPYPVLVVDSQNQVELSNPAARRVFGILAEESGERSRVAWQPPETLREPLRNVLRSEREYLPQGFENVISFRSEEDDRIYLPRILPIRDPHGAILGAAVILVDVTRFRLLDQIKSDLVATVSHELKTPLTSMSMAIHLLLEETVGPLTPKQVELLLDARGSSERLLAMINNLLDLARLEKGRGHLDVRPEDPVELLNAAAELVRRRADDQGVELVVDAQPGLPRVAVDGMVLGHALHNLLDNSLKYTPHGGRINLTAEMAGDFVSLAVADTGTGIPAESLSHVFDKFFRIPGQNRGSGTGLGLAIVREIVVAHGGDITCTSEQGKGTIFRLTLPVWHGNGSVEVPRQIPVSEARL
ncbi:MAG: ATP-binding protein [Thermoguttaceae bacterium]